MKLTMLQKPFWILIFVLFTSHSLALAGGWNKLPQVILDSLPRMSWKSIQGKPYFVREGVVFDFAEAIHRSEKNEKLKFHYEIFMNRLQTADQELSDRDLGLHERKSGKNSLVDYINQPDKAVGVIEDNQE
jgi:hypothetical protein